MSEIYQDLTKCPEERFLPRITAKEASIEITEVSSKLYSEAEGLRDLGLDSSSLFDLSRTLRMISDSM